MALESKSVDEYATQFVVFRYYHAPCVPLTYASDSLMRTTVALPSVYTRSLHTDDGAPS